MQDVARDREEIGLRRANGLVMLDSHQAQEHFLREVRCVGDVPQALRQEPPQLIAVAERDRILHF